MVFKGGNCSPKYDNLFFLQVSQLKYIRTMKTQIGKDNWDLKTYRKS
jgi:hypothetical protein